MNAEQFLREALESGQCPEHFEEIYRDFQSYQRRTLGSLRALHQVCEKNGIPYQLAYGSLLGVIRDNGQVPWDYDIDVFLPYREKDRLVEALRRELPEDYSFYCPDSDRRCRHFMMRIFPKGFSHETLHVDVFYVAGAPEEDTAAFGRRLWELFNLRFIKLADIGTVTGGDKKKAAELLLRKIKYLPLSLEKLEKEFDDLCLRYDPYTAKKLISVDSWADHQVLPPEMWDTELRETDAGTFRIPRNYDDMLTTMYGDYMTPPPLKNRLEELMYTYGRLKNGAK